MKDLYKGVEIVYNEHQEKFEAEFEGRYIRREKLSELKKYIDNPPEDKKGKPKFERIAVLDMGYHGSVESFKKCEITSFCDDRNECWVASGKGGRSRVGLSRLIMDCKDNHAIISAVGTLERSIRKIEKQILEISLGYKRPTAPTTGGEK